MLYVDHDNEPARRLYFSLGFGDDHTDRAYVTDLQPAAEIAAGSSPLMATGPPEKGDEP